MVKIILGLLLVIFIALIFGNSNNNYLEGMYNNTKKKEV